MTSTVVAIVVAILPLMSSPQDKHGWGLRVHRVSLNSPLLTGEAIDRCQLMITLINFSKRVQAHDPLTVAKATDDLQLHVLDPDGKNITMFHFGSVERDPFTAEIKLKPGESSSLDFIFANFGYFRVTKPGRYTIEAKMKIDGRIVTSPPLKFVVLDRKTEVILVSQAIPLEGNQLMFPVEQRDRPFIEETRAGGKTLLVYRRYSGANDKYISTFRLVELPGKVEMKVEGAYGAGKPLTITYKNAASPTGTTTLKINSSDGSPWTEEEERLLREREKAATPPAPGLVKP